MVDLPVPLGPSTLTNTPRCCLEKGRSFIAAPIGWQAAQLVERTCRSNVHEQSGRYQYVVGGSVWRQAIRELSRQCEGVDERAETVARLARQQATGKLERVEDLGTLPIVERALQHTDIYAGVMGDERGVHNAGVDVGVLQRTFDDWQCPEVFDTLKLARRLLAGQTSYRLGALVDAFALAAELPDGLTPHRATYDVLVTARLFVHIAAARSLDELRGLPPDGGGDEAAALF